MLVDFTRRCIPDVSEFLIKADNYTRNGMEDSSAWCKRIVKIQIYSRLIWNSDSYENTFFLCCVFAKEDGRKHTKGTYIFCITVYMAANVKTADTKENCWYKKNGWYKKDVCYQRGTGSAGSRAQEGDTCTWTVGGQSQRGHRYRGLGRNLQWVIGLWKSAVWVSWQ